MEWTITATVSSGDNLGLALIYVDLVQDAGNPETFDLPPAPEVPPLMEGFSRPAEVVLDDPTISFLPSRSMGRPWCGGLRA